MTALIHGQNLANKLRVVKDEANRRLLVEIKERYDHWHEENMRLQGCDKKTVERRVALLNEYMNFINEPRFRKEKATGKVSQPNLSFIRLFLSNSCTTCSRMYLSLQRLA